MTFEYLHEPLLLFGKDKHIDPRYGISNFHVYDIRNEIRKTELLIGIVGVEDDLHAIDTWLQRIASFIPAKAKRKQPNLFQSFIGFNKQAGFCASLLYSSETMRTVTPLELQNVLKIREKEQQVLEAVHIYYEHARYLSDVKNVDVIICIVPDVFEDTIALDVSRLEVEESAEDPDEPELETNFRRALKAKCFGFDTPIQIIRHSSLVDGKGKQDPATRAWNFSTALYYKALKTIPWKLDIDENRPRACFTGISFYRGRDRKNVQTSLAQIFNENGKGVVLRGTPVMLDKDDGIPHLTEPQAYTLLKEALTRYKFVLGNLPARLVIHKTSKYYSDEISGIESALQEFRIDQVDLVSIVETEIRFFRNAAYPPVRGSAFHLSDKNTILYTRGSVHYYQTYPGLYIPAPLDIRIVKQISSSRTIVNEILGLSKMNWNNTQFDNKFPITIGCSRRVGEIMKYLTSDQNPRESYAFYM